MTISTTESEVAYATDGVTTSFPIPFVFDSVDDLKVVLTDEDGNAVELTSGFTTTGGSGSTGTLVFTTAPANDHTLTIIDDPAIEQTIDYVSNDAFPAETNERGLDYLTRLVKRQARKALRSVRVSDGDLADASDLVLPAAVNRANRIFVFDADGKPEMALGVDVAINALTRSIIGGLLYPQTDRESTADVSPTDRAFPELDAERYGIVYDDESSASNNTAILNTLGSASWPGVVTLKFRDGVVWFDDTVEFTSKLMSLQCAETEFRYKGAADRPAIVFAGGTAAGIDGLQIINQTAHAYDNEDFVGLRFTDTREQNILVRRIQGFTINVQAYGATAGIGFNFIKVMRSMDALIHVDIHSFERPTSADGWINENEWHLLSLDNTSAYPTDINSYGVRFKAEPGAYNNVNNNIFFKPSFELENGDPGVERIPVLFDNAGTRDRFIAARVENGGPVLMKIISDQFQVNSNRLNVCYLSGTNFTGGSAETVLVENTDGGLGYGNYVELQGFGEESMPKWHSGDLVDQSFASSTTRIQTKGVFYQQQSESPRYDGAVRLGHRWLSITASSQAMGVFVDTSIHKEFTLRVSTLTGCNVAFVCFDEGGNVLDDGDAGHPHVAASATLTGSATFGYSYTTSGSNTQFVAFRVNSNVAKIALLIKGIALVSSFEITAIPCTRRPRALSVWSGFGGERLVDDSPATIRNGGYSQRGMIAFNDDAAASGTSYWQCTGSGWNATAWAPSTAYAVDQMVENDTGKVYVCREAGTSAGSGGPTGETAGITDGTVTWDYIGTLATWTAGPSNPS